MEAHDADAATTAYQSVQASPRGNQRGSVDGSESYPTASRDDGVATARTEAAVTKAAGLFLKARNRPPVQMTRTAEARVSTHGPTLAPASAGRRQTAADLEDGGDIPEKQLPRPPPSIDSSTRPLPSCFLGRGYRSNSYFARRLWNLTLVLAFLNAIGIAVFWLSKDIDNGGLYVRNPSYSLTFRESVCTSTSGSCESCKTLVVYATLVYHMLPVVVMMGLPASGWRVFEPFKRELRMGGEHRKSKIKRSLYLQACELVGVIVVLVNIMIFIYFVYSLFQGNNFNCHTDRVIIYSYCAVFCFFAMFVELTYFARFREHIKMLLGAFKEADHTGDIRARLSGRRDGYRSERSRIIHDIRKDLYRAAEMGNLVEVQEKLSIAQTRIGDNFVDVMYKNASIRLGIFSLSKKNPMHIAAYHGNVEVMDALLQVGFSVNGFDKVSRVRFTTGDLFWFFAQFFISKPVESSDETAASIFRTTLATPLHCAVSTGQIEAVQWLIRKAEARSIKSEVIHKLVEKGADINDALPNGDTPLHLAMKDENLASALTLVQLGASIMTTNSVGLRPIDCTTSTQLQFEVKNAAGNRDVMISYTHSHSEFALKLRKSLENAKITTWLDQMDPSGIGGGSVWREEIADGIRNASLVVCILTEDYAKSEWCLKELALAKECGKPILAVSTEHAKINEDLQVYLYTRQIVPFEPSITKVDNANPRFVTYEYDDNVFRSQFRLLLDGVRDEIERQRKQIVQRANLRLSSEMATFDPSAVTEFDVSTTTNDFVFISHGDKHLAFVQRIYDRLTGNGIYCFLDGANSTSDFQERMRVAKEAILKCSCFIVVISNRTSDNEVVRDQLAFAEDKGKPILPIMLNDWEITPDKLYTLSRSSLFHFTPELGFNASFTTLLNGVKQHVSNTSLQAMLSRRGGRTPALFSAVTRAAALNRVRMRTTQAQPSLGEPTAAAL
ncbi:hypothetical protein ATCC90586_001272 [Pythium insidiosum]|nr:hypothetical protein ATCC90586_001272 [Pythium insidiosum]